MTSTYLHTMFTAHIRTEEVHTIFECGSRDCLDAIQLAEYYKGATVYAFECNPESIPVCKKNIEGRTDIILIDKAVSDVNGSIPFYATDMERSVDKNIGASSLLRHLSDNKKEYIQKEIRVESIRLDTFMKDYKIEKIDLLCMDLQGAEPIVVNGLGDRTVDVRYVISEVCSRPYYYGNLTYGEFSRFMDVKGFRHKRRRGDDALYEHV